MSKGIPVITINKFGGATLFDENTGWLYEGNSKEESNNKGYRELLQNYDEKGEKLDYLEIQNKLRYIELNNGLSTEENEILFNTVFVDEAVQLILKGLQTI